VFFFFFFFFLKRVYLLVGEKGVVSILRDQGENA